jgi:peptide chain release factor 1
MRVRRHVTVFSFSLIEISSGYVAIEVEGQKAWKIFQSEAGGHRWQRVPPTERHGRTQTSTVTVAVIHSENTSVLNIKSSDLQYEFYKSGGPGGQHKNTTLSAVRLRHIPTGITVNVSAGRCQHQNKASALVILKSKLLTEQKEKIEGKENRERREQIGSGMRGDKIRTYSVKNDTVSDHRTNKTTTIKRFSKGFIEDLR